MDDIVDSPNPSAAVPRTSNGTGRSRGISRSSAVSLFALAGLVLIGAVLVTVWGGQTAKSTLNSEVRTVASQLRCPVCQVESVYDSPAGLAGSMRSIIRQQLKQGRTPSQVESFFVSRYGQWILLAPPTTGIGALIWFGPPLLLIIGLLFLLAAADAWRKNMIGYGRPAIDSGVTDAEDAPYLLERLEDLHDEGTVSDTAYEAERLRLEREQSLSRASTAKRPGRFRNRHAVQLIGIVVAAAAIASTIALAVQPRGAGAVTGTVPGTSTTPTPTSRRVGPPDVVAALNLVDARPRDVSAWDQLGSVLIAHSHFSAGSLAFRHALRLDWADTQARFGLAFVAIHQGSERGVIKILAPIAARELGSPRLWLYEGLANAQIGNREAAITDLHHVLALAPGTKVKSSVIQLLTNLERGREAP